jgi:hypothetical protein
MLRVREEEEGGKEFLYNRKESVSENVCRMLRFFRYKEFKDARDLLAKVEEFTLIVF